MQKQEWLKLFKQLKKQGELRMTTFTREQLELKTVPELRRMCVYELNITGMTKRPKEVIIDAIMTKFGARVNRPYASEEREETPVGITGVEFTGRSILTKPGGQFGQRTTTTIHVSCGAASGSFPVVGRSVVQVADFLREVLNVDTLSTGLVNGKEVPQTYILKPGDALEFMKPAGTKG